MTGDNPTTTSPERRRSALLMALYTFLLALGAAMPLAASFHPGLMAQAPEGGIECGGYARRVSADPSDEDQSAERPRASRVTVCAEASELDPASSPVAPRRAAPRDPSFRGS
jgi:hypothetical protein